VKFAQYGVSHAHARGKAAVMKANEDVDFCGVYEPDAEVRSRLGSNEAYEGIHWYENKREMLEDESIAAIAVEGTVAQNLRFTRDVLGHGKHAWLDKPAGDDWEAFKSLIALAKEQELLVQLGYMFRYNAAFQFILDWADSGRLGDVFSVRGRMSTRVTEDKRASLAVHEGGILFELLCHLIDIAVALLGRPDKVTSFLRNEAGSVPGFRDNTAAVFDYAGAMAILESSAMEVAAFPSRRFEVYGTKGSAIMEPLEPDPVLRLCLDKDRDGFKEGWQVVPVSVEPRYVGSLRALVANIQGTGQPDRSLDHELDVQETVLRAAGILSG
jgi:predicted dehydrogenase